MPIAALAMATLVMPALVLAAPAGEFNKKLSAGDAAPAWTDVPGASPPSYSTPIAHAHKFYRVRCP